MWVECVLTFIFFVLLISYTKVSCIYKSYSQNDLDKYLRNRSLLLQKEKAQFIGGCINLTANEKIANKIILRNKLEELCKAYKNESSFLPAQIFLEAKNNIEKSKIFQMIRKLPKGASLHTHMLAAVNTNFIIRKITYRDNLYGGFIADTFKLRFFNAGQTDVRCDWKLLKEYRKEDPDFDDKLKEYFQINSRDRVSSDVVWTAFKKIFNTGYEMFSYKPVFEDMIYQLLLELHEDNVMYAELKGTIMPLYDLDDTKYGPQDFFEILNSCVGKFKEVHEDFIGIGYIHSIYRGVHNSVLLQDIELIIKMKKLYPGLIIGFDFVGYEEEGNSILNYIDILLEKQNQIDFYFHAGETNWYGHTDLNLADAILLKCKRIGHGYAITKHPEMLNLAKRKNIPFEICPISNQVLLLHQDPRSHPANHLFATGYPVVICNDDPSIWGATGLSYDWYIVFMSMTAQNTGIGCLKSLALNSIKYSALPQEQKKRAFAVWNKKWEDFVSCIIKDGRIE